MPRRSTAKKKIPAAPTSETRQKEATASDALSMIRAEAVALAAHAGRLARPDDPRPEMVFVRWLGSAIDLAAEMVDEAHRTGQPLTLDRIRLREPARGKVTPILVVEEPSNIVPVDFKKARRLRPYETRQP